MRLTKEIMTKYYGHMEDHKFRHYNDALQMMIYSKEHYIHEMNKRGMVPYEMALELAAEHDRKNPRQEYKLSAKAEDIIRNIKVTADRHGNVQLGGRAIEALKAIGAIKSDEVRENHQKILREEQLI